MRPYSPQTGASRTSAGGDARWRFASEHTREIRQQQSPTMKTAARQEARLDAADQAAEAAMTSADTEAATDHPDHPHGRLQGVDTEEVAAAQARAGTSRVKPIKPTGDHPR